MLWAVLCWQPRLVQGVAPHISSDTTGSLTIPWPSNDRKIRLIAPEKGKAPEDALANRSGRSSPRNPTAHFQYCHACCIASRRYCVLEGTALKFSSQCSAYKHPVQPLRGGAESCMYHTDCQTIICTSLYYVASGHGTHACQTMHGAWRIRSEHVNYPLRIRQNVDSLPFPGRSSLRGSRVLYLDS